MAKLRKMLGNVESAECKEIMAIISTQSQHTIERWAVGFAAERCLPVFENECPGEALMRATVEKCREYFAGGIKLRELKPMLSEARKYASGVKGDIAQAAARAVSAACASVQTPTNAFGFLMYSAAANAYAQLGLDKTIDEYEAKAVEEMRFALDSLRSAAVENEPNPVKVNWNC